MKFILDLKTITAKSSSDAKLNRIKLAITRNDRDIALEEYKHQFNDFSMKCGLVFNDDKITVLNELRKKLLVTLYFGHARTKNGRGS